MDAKGERMQEYMRLKNPTQVRIVFTEEKGWHTITEMADNLGISNHKVSKALRGGSITTATAQVIAHATNEDFMSIVEFVPY